MFQTTNQHSFVSEMSEIHPSSSDKRENNGLKVQFHRWYLTEWWSLLEQKWRSKAYVHLSQPGTGNHVFFYFHFFVILIIIFLDWKLSLPPIPVKFFHYFFIPVFPPFGIFMFLSSASKMVLGPWELPPGTFSGTLFVSFHFVSFLYCFGYFSFLCLENCPWKLSKGVFSRTLFVFFRFCIVLAMVPSFALKIDLGDCQKTLFSNPFRCFSVFFRFGYFSSFAFKIDLGNCRKGQKEFFPFFFVSFFIFVVFRFFCRFLFFHVRFHFRFFFVFLLSSFFVFRTWWQNVKGNRYEHDNINCTSGKHDKHFFHIIGEWKK